MVLWSVVNVNALYRAGIAVKCLGFLCSLARTVVEIQQYLLKQQSRFLFCNDLQLLIDQQRASNKRGTNRKQKTDNCNGGDKEEGYELSNNCCI